MRIGDLLMLLLGFIIILLNIVLVILLWLTSPIAGIVAAVLLTVLCIWAWQHD